MQQVSNLVARLLNKTQAKMARWSQTAETGKYQIRFGDFSITISPQGSPNAFQREIQLQIQKLSGEQVASVSTQLNALGAILPNSVLADPLVAANLRTLYSLVADKSDDLDELIKLIG